MTTNYFANVSLDPDNPLVEGRMFCFTGKLQNFTRAQATEAVEACGGFATSQVSASLDYLVCGTPPTATVTKNDERLTKKRMTAREHGVEVISESDFIALMIGAEHQQAV